MGIGENFTVIDTPAFGDFDGQDEERFDATVKFMKNEVKKTNIFLLLIDGDSQHIHSGLHQMLRNLELMFGDNFWSHVIFGITFWPFDQRSIEDRMRK